MTRRYWHIDIDEFTELWHADTPSADMAARFCVSRQRIAQLRVMFGLPQRNLNEIPPPSEEEDDLSGESLEFSPFVKRRIAELGLGAK
jgi:hypothetical protein